MNEILSSVLKVGFSTVASLVGWVVATKVLSMELGALGVGLFGLLRQMLQNLNSHGTFTQSALVQGIAGSEGGDSNAYAGVVFRLLLGFTLLIAAILFVFSPFVGPWLLPHPKAVTLLRWLALALICLSAQTYFNGVLNGHRLINELVKAQFLVPLSVLVLILPMIWLVRREHAVGYVLMLGVPPAVSAAAAGWYAFKAGHCPSFFRGGFPRNLVRHFLEMSGVLVLTGLLTTGAIYFQNWIVARKLGLEQAGHFWTAWTLSMTYVTLVLSSYSTYYMPSLASIGAVEERKLLIRRYLKLSLLAMPVLVCAVVVIKPMVIKLMFSATLLPAVKVMRWMLIGDFFKGVSWVMSFPMLAFRNMKWFFWSDFFLFPGMALSSYWWIDRGGSIEGIGIIFMIFYILYFILMTYYIQRMHQFVWTRDEWLQFLSAVLLILLVSKMTWEHQVIHGYAIFASIAGCAAYLGFWMRIPLNVFNLKRK